VRLFFAGGGPVGEEVMFGSCAPAEAGATDGPDMARVVAPDPEARLLFRALDGDKFSGLAEESTVEV
jgi:hypothetical protein